MKSLVFALLMVGLVGTQATEFQSRILNGLVASPNQFPWFASVQGRQANGADVLCGGALVSPAFVITAAHCVANLQTVSIGLGSNTLSSPQISMLTNSWIIHPQYNTTNFANNIALLRLPVNITNTPSVAPIRLPTISQNNVLFVNELPTVSGFGRTENNGNVSNILRFATTRVITNADCVPFYGSVFLTNTVICTVGRDIATQGPCQSDDGSPLVLAEPTGNTLIGVNSFISQGGCLSGHPAAYTRVSLFTQWISQQIGIPTRP